MVSSATGRVVSRGPSTAVKKRQQSRTIIIMSVTAYLILIIQTAPLYVNVDTVSEGLSMRSFMSWVRLPVLRNAIIISIISQETRMRDRTKALRWFGAGGTPI